MVIRHLNVVRIAIFKTKAYTPLVVNGNRILSNPISLQLVKPIARRQLQVIYGCGEIKILQLAQCPLPNSRRKPLRLAAVIQLLRAFVGKCLDHAQSVMPYVTPVNPGSWLIALRPLSPLRNTLASTENRKVTSRAQACHLNASPNLVPAIKQPIVTGVDFWWEQNVSVSFSAGSTQRGFQKTVTTPSPVQCDGP